MKINVISSNITPLADKLTSFHTDYSILLECKDTLWQISDVMKFIDVRTNVLLIDINVIDDDYIDVINVVKSHYPKLKVVALVQDYQNITIKQLIMAGFRACLLWGDVEDRITDLIQDVINGKFCFSKKIPLGVNVEEPIMAS